MSDAVKWGLLVVGAVLIVGLIVALPFVEFINFEQFGSAVTNIVTIAGNAFRFGRGLINNFLLPFGRSVASGIMIWLLGKWAITTTIKITVQIYHFIFK